MNYNPYSLDRKTILITGASSGIGKATAIECSKMGANLIITGRDEDKLNSTFKQLEGSSHLMVQADLTTKEGMSALFEILPKIDGCVLAAGIVEMMPLLFASNEKFQKIYNTNFFSPIEILRLIIKKKKFNIGFSTVAIASVAGSSDFTMANGIYGSGKAALISFFKYAALELASKKVRVNTISPGLILTPMHTEGAVDKEHLEKEVSKIPLKKWGQPEDIAFAVIYLLSDVAKYVTGTDICIDGGLTI